MIQVAPQIRILVAVEAIDGRKYAPSMNPARNRINTNTVLENGADLCRRLAQLNTAWIIFRKYTWVGSAKRRRHC
jgi:hypothetical protein